MSVAQRIAAESAARRRNLRTLRRARRGYRPRGGRGSVAGRARGRLSLCRRGLWREAWPTDDDEFSSRPARRRRAARLLDNLYMYGPQTAPLTETTPLTDSASSRRRARRRRASGWRRARRAGPRRGAARARLLRPRREAVLLGDTGFGALARGRRALSSARPIRRTTSPTSPISRAPSSACSTRPTTPSARPGTSPARRPARRAKSSPWRGGDRRRAEVRGLPPRCSRARPVRPAAARTGEMVPVGSPLSRRFEPIRAALLVRRDAVRGRRAGGRAFVSDAAPRDN